VQAAVVSERFLTKLLLRPQFPYGGGKRYAGRNVAGAVPRSPKGEMLREKELLGKLTSDGLWTSHTLNNSTGTF
jgi:hypothetical protein